MYELSIRGIIILISTGLVIGATSLYLISKIFVKTIYPKPDKITGGDDLENKIKGITKYDLIEPDINQAFEFSKDVRNRSIAFAQIEMTLIGVIIVGLSYIYKDPLITETSINISIGILAVWALISLFSSLFLSLLIPTKLKPARRFPVVNEPIDLINEVEKKYLVKVYNSRYEAYKLLIDRWSASLKILDISYVFLRVGIISFTILGLIVILSLTIFKTVL